MRCKSKPIETLKSGLEAALDLVLPPRCCGCDGPAAPGQAFCEACRPSLLEPENPCPCCGLPGVTQRCPACRNRTRPLASARSAFLYGGALAQAIHRLKFRGATHLARPLGRLMVPLAVALEGSVDVAVPVPLHRRRLRARGFNQAALLARCLGLPLRHDVLERVRETLAQTDLGAAERWANVRGAFRAGRRASGRRVLIVDDVSTTGATATACATALLDAGAHEVHLLTLARAMP